MVAENDLQALASPFESEGQSRAPPFPPPAEGVGLTLAELVATVCINTPIRVTPNPNPNP